MAATIEITYINNGSTPRPYAEEEGITLGEFLEDSVDVDSQDVEVQLNGRVNPNLATTLRDGDEVSVASKKHKSGN